MDVSMDVHIALGHLQIKGSELGLDDRVRVIRALTGNSMVRHLRGCVSMAELLRYRHTKHGRRRRILPTSTPPVPPDLMEHECIELHSHFEWKNCKRLDTILYISRAGQILMWEGECTVLQRAEADAYDSLSISWVDDSRLRGILEGSNFETLVETIRVMQKKSLDAAEQSIRQLRDCLRSTSDIQRRMRFFPQDRLRD